MSIKTVATTTSFFSQGYQGNYLRILSASADKPVQIRFHHDDGGTDEIELVAGLGIRKTKPFLKFEIASTEAQTVKFYAGQDEVSDDRLAGNFDINAALSVAQTAPTKHEVKPVQNISALTEVLPARATRKTALIQVNGAVYVGSADGVQLSGTFAWDNQAALSLIPVSGTVEVRINEDYD